MRRAAGALFIEPQSRRAFLVRRSSIVSEPGTWSNPGGHIEPGEDDLGAAMRELFEETRLRPLGDPITCVEIPTYSLFVALLSPKEAATVLRDCRLNTESDAAGWFDIDNIIADLPGPLHPGLKLMWPLILDSVDGVMVASAREHR